MLGPTAQLHAEVAQCRDVPGVIAVLARLGNAAAPIKSLKLTQVDVSSLDDGAALVQALRTHTPDLTGIELHRVDNAHHIVQQLHQLDNLAAVTVHGFGIRLSAECFRALARLPQLQHLNISGIRLDGTTAPLLGRLTHLRSLDVSFCNVGLAGVKAISRLPLLETLSLRGNSRSSADAGMRIGAQACGLLRDAAMKGGKAWPLKKLDMRQMALTDSGLEQLNGCKNLYELDVSTNDLTYAGTSQSLAFLTTLRRLDISDNRLGRSGVQRVMQQVRSHASLKTLTLGSNRLTRDELRAAKAQARKFTFDVDF